MKILLLIVCLTSFGLSAQIQKNNQQFNDYKYTKDFDQGVLDAKRHFDGTRDFVIGFVSFPAYYVPAVICYATPPKDRRFINLQNPNNDYLFSNSDYYQGYRYGATKKKRKRLMEGSITSIGIGATLIFFAISSLAI